MREPRALLLVAQADLASIPRNDSLDQGINFPPDTDVSCQNEFAVCFFLDDVRRLPMLEIHMRLLDSPSGLDFARQSDEIQLTPATWLYHCRIHVIEPFLKV